MALAAEADEADFLAVAPDAEGIETFDRLPLALETCLGIEELTPRTPMSSSPADMAVLIEQDVGVYLSAPPEFHPSPTITRIDGGQ